MDSKYEHGMVTERVVLVVFHWIGCSAECNTAEPGRMRSMGVSEPGQQMVAAAKTGC